MLNAVRLYMVFGVFNGVANMVFNVLNKVFSVFDKVF